MFAIKDKALSAGVLTNPIKINEIISIMGNHVRTNLSPDELQQLIKLVKESDANVITKVLDTSAGSPLIGTTDERGYVIVPRDGDYTYPEVKRIAHEIFTDPYLVKENARIEVQNGTGKSGLGATVASLLKSNSYNVVKVSNTPTKEPYTELIDYSGAKYPFTISFLEKRFGVKARTLSRPDGVEADIVFVLGSDYQYNVQSASNAKK